MFQMCILADMFTLDFLCFLDCHGLCQSFQFHRLPCGFRIVGGLLIFTGSHDDNVFHSI